MEISANRSRVGRPLDMSVCRLPNGQALRLRLRAISDGLKIEALIDMIIDYALQQPVPAQVTKAHKGNRSTIIPHNPESGRFKKFCEWSLQNRQHPRSLFAYYVKQALNDESFVTVESFVKVQSLKGELPPRYRGPSQNQRVKSAQLS